MTEAVFLRAFGRTGGTLLATVLDAHPDMAMSYEIYQDRLVPDSGGTFTVSEAAALVAEARDDDPRRWIKQIGDANLRKFATRCRRGAIDPDLLLAELRGHGERGGGLDDLAGRLDFIEHLMRVRARREGARVWGGKFARVTAEELHRRHPDAVFVATVRDGRDVLASQLNVGNFRTTPVALAGEWAAASRGFRAFAARTDVRAMEVRYESLVADPEGVLRALCDLIDVDFDARMLHYEDQDVALLRTPTGHLSGEQIQRGLNADSIGRWRRDLTVDQVSAFTAVAGDALREAGYDV